MAEKHGWQEPMVWSLALEGKTDHDRFKELGWGFRTWDQWEFNDCDNRFGDDWPGRIPAQLIAHILRYFSQPGDLVLDPMAGGGVTPDTCLAMGRRCWAFDMKDRPDTRPEIEPFTWENSSDQGLSWPVSAKGKPDLILFDPPYFDKKAGDYDEKSISGLSRNDYLGFLEAFFAQLKPHVIPALQRRCRIGHAEKQHPGGDQPVCDRPEPAGSGMMQLQYPMPMKISEDNYQRQ